MTPLATTTATTSARNDTSTPVLLAHRVTAAMLIGQFILMFAALFILGSTINWPASLDEPAAVTLPLILEQSAAVALGYSSYFVSSLLLAPIALLIFHLGRGTRDSATLLVAVGFGVLASFAKLLGISRWLLMMPLLAQAYVDPQASDGTRAAITVTFDAFNNYAGGVGEVLGVALLTGLWTGLVSVVLLRQSTLAPRWMGAFGLVVTALLLVAVAGAYGVDMGPILILQGLALQFWMLFLGIFLLRGTRRPRA